MKPLHLLNLNLPTFQWITRHLFSYGTRSKTKNSHKKTKQQKQTKSTLITYKYTPQFPFTY